MDELDRYMLFTCLFNSNNDNEVMKGYFHVKEKLKEMHKREMEDMEKEKNEEILRLKKRLEEMVKEKAAEKAVDQAPSEEKMDFGESEC